MNTKMFVKKALKHYGDSDLKYYNQVLASLDYIEDFTSELNKAKTIKHICKSVVASGNMLANPTHDVATNSEGKRILQGSTYPNLVNVGEFDSTLQKGFDPYTGDPIFPIIVNERENRFGFYNPKTRCVFPTAESV